MKFHTKPPATVVPLSYLNGLTTHQRELQVSVALAILHSGSTCDFATLRCYSGILSDTAIPLCTRALIASEVSKLLQEYRLSDLPVDVYANNYLLDSSLRSESRLHQAITTMESGALVTRVKQESGLVRGYFPRWVT